MFLDAVKQGLRNKVKQKEVDQVVQLNAAKNKSCIYNLNLNVIFDFLVSHATDFVELLFYMNIIRK